MRKKDTIEELKDEYTLLCVDPSLNCTGYSILKISNKEPFNLNNKNVSLIDYGIIPTNHLKVGYSLMYFEKVMSNVIDKYKPDYVTSEQMFAGKNRNTGMKLAYIHGILQLICAKNHLSIIYYSVMTAKSKTLDGIKTKHDDGTKKTGDEMKQEVADKVMEIIGKESFHKEYTLDVTDSISMGITFIKMDGKEIEKAKKTKKKKTAKSKK